MATVGTRNLTLADVAKRLDPDGKVAAVIELLNEDNDFVNDMVVKECNDGTTNKTTVRTGIPSGTWRTLYSGVLSTKSSTKQVVDSTGMLEALPKIDVDVVDKSGDPAGTLLSEQLPHIEGLGQDVESTGWYGDTRVYPERFMGLSPRYDKLSTDPDLSGYNVFNGGGTGSDNTSVWLLGWGDNSLHGLYPKGSQAGLMVKNMSEVGGKGILTAADDGSGDFEAYVTKYKWDVGLTLRDWRTCGRICNLDISNLESGTGAADLIKLMIQLSERVRGPGRRIFYMHKRVRTALRLQILDFKNTNVTFDTVEGKKVMFFDEIPVHESEKLLLTEAKIT